MRFTHILRGNARSETVHSAVWFDTETTQHPIDNDTVEHKLSFGYAAHRRRIRGGKWSAAKWFRFTTNVQFFSWLEALTRPKIKTFCFCHNTSFDLIVLNLFGIMPAMGWRLTGAIIEAPPTIIRFTKEGRSLVFLDTLNWWRMSLKELGKSIGLEKYEMPSFLAGKAAWNKYARRDVEIIMEACLKWFAYLQDNDLGGFAMTLAGQAFRSYRHRFMTTEILIDCNEGALRVSRSAIFGGRNECFRLGHVTGPIHYLDINSMYLYVMRTHMFPTRLIAYKTRVNLHEIPDYCRNRAITARVEVVTDTPFYPLRDRNKLLFPIGRFETWLSTPELLFAARNGHITRIWEMAIYDVADIFSTYVDYFYNSRWQAVAVGDTVTAELHKKLGNTLWGKFSQHGYRYSEETWISDTSAKTWIEVNAQTGEVKRFRQFGGLVQAMSEEREAMESHPAIASHVTAYGRCMLWDAMVEAGHENVIYCDTDSLFLTGQGYDNLRSRIDRKLLGHFKEEGRFDDVEIFGCKDYTLGNIEKHKGVKSRAEWLDASTVRQEQWSSLKGAIRNGSISAPTTTTVTKELKRIYEKGTVTPEGRITPYVIDDTAPSGVTV